MPGRGATRKQYPHKHRAMIRKFERDMQQLSDSFPEFHRILVEEISKAYLDIGYDILFDAAAACPYETGALRNSGTMSFVVGMAGRISPALIVKDATPAPNDYFRIVRIGNPIKRIVNRLDIMFSFEREDKGIDIALYAHEELLPYPPRVVYTQEDMVKFRVMRARGIHLAKGTTWHARQPGTGPKYLENAVNTHIRDVEKMMEEAKEKAMARYVAKYKNIAE